MRASVKKHQEKPASHLTAAIAGSLPAVVVLFLLALLFHDSPDTALRRFAPSGVLLLSSALAGMTYSAKR